ncbi:MAG: hypothetical protein ACQR33_00615 [Candidatus Saccharibacteria bacterium]
MSELLLPHFEPDVDIERVVILGHMGRDSVRGYAAAWEENLTTRWPNLEVVVLPTRAGGIQPNTELFLENQHLFDPHTVKAKITGDGGANDLLNASVKAAEQYPHIGDAMYLFGPGGTMCDTARSLNRKRCFGNPAGILERGWLSTMHLLELTLQIGDETEVIKAMNYPSIGGISGKVSELINGDDYRNSPMLRTYPTKRLRQALAVLEAKRKAEPITIAENGGEPQTLSDVLYLSGPRMAGMHNGAKQLTEPGYHRVEIKNTSWPHLALKLGRLVTGTLIPNGKPTTDETHIELMSDAILQYDGETRALQAGDRVAIRPGPQIRAVTTLAA